ncbi:amino acid ABC transporter permease [Salirhabdus sp. Marseille-P4669]|uniref:amino acid ABC transporter permease n=1 Tax=Salirhabdus sp. Marseille-P4669 TaxID=2042310 RepID=UPI000C7C9919|nr:amino acid ABC transporter permease [Salirhabdus sp. Marseille-P4669]
MDFSIIVEYLPFFLKGTMVTLGISFMGILIGVLVGLFIALGKMSPSRIVRLPFTIYINIIRGTPTLVQIFLIHFAVLPAIYEDRTAILSAIVTLSINSSAYVAEIFRAGIESIHNGQMEAARSLGMTKVQAMRFIIIPQATRRVIPPLGNEFITLIKESSLAAMIAAEELFYWGKAAVGKYYAVWEPYLTVALIYLVIVLGMTYLLQIVEKKWVNV